ncbi:hypothetical protein RIR_jg16287.t1 [Rhizophagus irregularis DAOM 181602=DAOM 197198]|nr:hypothetical protein RIR_jg16287.t1 [Rhizophagus irregularis DAOM 181602=DAOM 197198]
MLAYMSFLIFFIHFIIQKYVEIQIRIRSKKKNPVPPVIEPIFMGENESSNREIGNDNDIIIASTYNIL